MENKRSGKPRKLTKGDEKYLKINSLRDRKKSSKAIAADFAHSTGRQVHPSTVRRALIRNGLHGRAMAGKQGKTIKVLHKGTRIGIHFSGKGTLE